MFTREESFQTRLLYFSRPLQSPGQLQQAKPTEDTGKSMPNYQLILDNTPTISTGPDSKQNANFSEIPQMGGTNIFK